jgi:hypothetical protein
MSLGSEAQAVDLTTSDDTIRAYLYDATQSAPENLTFFSGACFGVDRAPEEYAPSVTTNSSLPLHYDPRHSSVEVTSLDRDYHSDNHDTPEHDLDVSNQGHNLSISSHRARSVPPAAQSVRLWQEKQDDWKTKRPSRSVAHAKRRHKHKVRRSLEKVDAIFHKNLTSRVAGGNGDEQDG